MLRYFAWGMPVYQLVVLPLLLVLSVGILLGSFRQDEKHGTRIHQPSVFITGLIGLCYVACNVYLYWYGGLIGSRVIALAVYITPHLFGGVFAAMLISIVFPRSMRALLLVSGVVLVALNIFAFWFETRYRARVLLSSDGTGFFMGALLSFVLSRMEAAKRTVSPHA
jgi:hypothetical protein